MEGPESKAGQGDTALHTHPRQTAEASSLCVCGAETRVRAMPAAVLAIKSSPDLPDPVVCRGCYSWTIRHFNGYHKKCSTPPLPTSCLGHLDTFARAGYKLVPNKQQAGKPGKQGKPPRSKTGARVRAREEIVAVKEESEGKAAGPERRVRQRTSPQPAPRSPQRPKQGHSPSPSPSLGATYVWPQPLRLPSPASSDDSISKIDLSSLMADGILDSPLDLQDLRLETGSDSGRSTDLARWAALSSTPTPTGGNPPAHPASPSSFAKVKVEGGSELVRAAPDCGGRAVGYQSAVKRARLTRRAPAVPRTTPYRVCLSEGCVYDPDVLHIRKGPLAELFGRHPRALRARLEGWLLAPSSGSVVVDSGQWPAWTASCELVPTVVSSRQQDGSMHDEHCVALALPRPCPALRSGERMKVLVRAEQQPGVDQAVCAKAVAECIVYASDEDEVPLQLPARGPAAAAQREERGPAAAWTSDFSQLSKSIEIQHELMQGVREGIRAALEPARESGEEAPELRKLLDTPLPAGAFLTSHSFCTAMATVMRRLARLCPGQQLWDLQAPTSKFTLLHYAASVGCEPVVAQLLQARASTVLLTGEGLTAAAVAAQHGDPVIAALLQQHTQAVAGQTDELLAQSAADLANLSIVGGSDAALHRGGEGVPPGALVEHSDAAPDAAGGSPEGPAAAPVEAMPAEAGVVAHAATADLPVSAVVDGDSPDSEDSTGSGSASGAGEAASPAAQPQPQPQPSTQV